jgi:hypothetical protein
MKKLVSMFVGLSMFLMLSAAVAVADDFKAIQLASGTYTLSQSITKKDTIAGMYKIDAVGQNTYGREASIYLNVVTVSGTVPALDVIIEDSPDGGTWYFVKQFNRMTAASSAVIRYGTDFYSFGRYVRARFVIGGTTPSFKCFVDMNIRR